MVNQPFISFDLISSIGNTTNLGKGVFNLQRVKLREVNLGKALEYGSVCKRVFHYLLIEKKCYGGILWQVVLRKLLLIVRNGWNHRLQWTNLYGGWKGKRRTGKWLWKEIDFSLFSSKNKNKVILIGWCLFYSVYK